MSLIFTNEGLSKEAEFIANGVTYSITEFAVSDQKQASYDGSEIALTNEVYRAAINTITTATDTDGDKVIEISFIIPLDTTNFFIREIGFFADDGKLIAIGSVPELEKTSINDSELTQIEMIATIKITNTDAVNISINPNVITATQKYVDDSVNDHNLDTEAHPSILGTIATMQTQIDGMLPPAMVMPYAGFTAPTGWLECNGAAISRTTYVDLFNTIGETFGIGDGSTTFNIPDLRGEFVRGWDNFRGIDVDRTLGSSQADELKAHTHSYNTKTGTLPQSGDTTQCWVGDQSGTTGSTGGNETRPRNVALMYIIKT